MKTFIKQKLIPEADVLSLRAGDVVHFKNGRKIKISYGPEIYDGHDDFYTWLTVIHNICFSLKDIKKVIRWEEVG